MDQKPHTPSQYVTQACIDACSHCHQICLYTAMNQCIESGANTVEAKMLRLLLSCAEICQVSANFQLGNSGFQHRVCELCAEVCEACAANCEVLEGLESCAKACRACAESCRQMGRIQD
jgi:hypothetical protein